MDELQLTSLLDSGLPGLSFSSSETNPLDPATGLPSSSLFNPIDPDVVVQSSLSVELETEGIPLPSPTLSSTADTLFTTDLSNSSAPQDDLTGTSAQVPIVGSSEVEAFAADGPIQAADISLLPDLVGQFGTITLPQSLTPGGQGQVQVRLTNQGIVPAIGAPAIDLYFSSNTSLDSSDVSLGRINTNSLLLLVGQSQTYSTTVTVPTTLPSGSYYLLANIDASSVLLELNETNNLAVSSNTFTLAPPVTVTANLANDTAANGTTNSDRITADATITGSVSNVSSLATLTAGFDTAPTSSYVNITADLAGNGSFTLSRTRLEQIYGGVLTEGSHTLHLRAQDTLGNLSTVDLNFTLDTTAPTPLTLMLDPAFDTAPVGDGRTLAETVTITGQTEAGAIATLQTIGNSTTANAIGQFQFSNIALDLGSNAFIVQSTDVAGNVSSAVTTQIIRSSPGDVVTQWNNILLNAIQTDKTAPPLAARNLAIVQAAVFDAVNSIDQSYAPYYISAIAPAGASIEAAAVAAAYYTLVSLYPAQQATFDAALAQSLATIPDGQVKIDGVLLGQRVAGAILAWRQTDGSDRPTPHTPGTEPGDWQPTPPGYQAALASHWGSVIPFALDSGDQFRPDGPPALDSADYAVDFNQVKELGRGDSTTRTADQTQIAQFWADGAGTYTPAGHWNQIAREVSLREGNSLIENARLLAVLDVGLADAGIAAWDAKYTFNFWRPVTAIQQADTDGNPLTEADPTWTSLLTTPPFPDYVSGHSTYSGTADAILTDLLGNDLSFTNSSVGLSGISRTFTNFTTAADEAGISRIYGGIHFNSANQDGLDLGRSIGSYVVDQVLEAVPVLVQAQLANDTAPQGTTNVDTLTADATINGKVIDPSLVSSLKVGFKDAPGDFVDVTTEVNADGIFTLDREALEQILGASLLNGSYTVVLQATNTQGQTSDIQVAFTLDDTPPLLSITNPLTPTSSFIDIALDGLVTDDISNEDRYILTVTGGENNGQSVEITSVETFSPTKVRLNLAELLDVGDYNLTVTGLIDQAGNALGDPVSFTVAPAPVKISPADGEEFVSTTREIIVHFGKKVNPATVTAESFYLLANGEQISGRISVSSTEEFATLFYDEPLPASTRVRVVVDGNQIIGRDGQALDDDGNGVAGGIALAEFSTVSLTPIEGTDVFGYVYDSYNKNSDGSNIPVVGATIRLDGLPDLTATTDENGYFILENVPAPEFFVHIDGSTAINAPAGETYATVGKPFHSIPGQATQLTMDGAVFDIYLPPMAAADVQPLSPTGDTDVGFGAAGKAQLVELFPEVDPSFWDLTKVTFTAGSAQDEQGNAATQGLIIPVAPDRLPAPLPPNVDPKLVISVQAPGATNFDIPAAVQFPNLEGLQPGEKSLIWSFNHDSGKWEVIGTGTVSADGKMIVSDPGVGIQAPGWHFAQPGVLVGGGGVNGLPDTPPAPPAPPDDPDEEYDDVEIKVVGFIPTQVASIVPQEAVPILQFILSQYIGNPDSFNPLDLRGILTSLGSDLSTGILRRALFYLAYSMGVIDPQRLPPGAAPRDWLLPLIKGDNRGYNFTNNEDFTYQSDKYRVYQDVTVTVDPDSDEGVVEEDRVDWGSSQIYPVTTGGHVDDRPWWWWQLKDIEDIESFPKGDLDLFPGKLNINKVDVNPLDEQNIVRVHHQMEGSIPIVNAAPTLSADLTIDIYQAEGKKPMFRISGSHDGFPAYAIYINGNLEYLHHPELLGKSPYNLSDFDETADGINEIFNTIYGNTPLEQGSTTTSGGRDIIIPPSQWQVVEEQPESPPDLSFETIEELYGYKQENFSNSQAIRAFEVFASDSQAFGSEDELELLKQTGNHYYAVYNVLTGAVEQRGISKNGIALEDIALAANGFYQLILFQPETKWVGSTSFMTGSDGSRVSVKDVLISDFDSIDTDSDGLGDVAELVIGSDDSKVDTDGDGISDLAELEQGLDPLGGFGFPTGIIASLPLPGEATSVVVEGSTSDARRQTAYVTTRYYGLATVDASQFDNPILLGRLELSGEMTDVAVDSNLQIAAVASRYGGLHLVNVSDPMLPKLLRTINVDARQVEVVDGVAYAAVDNSLQVIDLLTGSLLQDFELPGSGSIIGMAREGTKLYTFTSSSQTLSVIDITDADAATVIGQLSDISISNTVTVFAANGIVYLGGAGRAIPNGLVTVDVSDPATPTLISPADLNFDVRGLALNGSGLALVGSEVAGRGVGIYDITDPGDTDNLVSRISMPGQALSIAIASGIGFVASGDNGLQVINYRPFDNQGQAPTVSISTSIMDADPNQVGVQVVEGSVIPVQATVLDDVQVRNVELLLNGTVVQNDVSFPFDLSAITPSLKSGVNEVMLQVRATDTGGNVTLSNPLTLQIAPDTIAPVLEEFTFSRIINEEKMVATFRFSEAIDAQSVTTANFRLESENEVIFTPQVIQLRDGERVVQLVYETLPQGTYNFILNAPNITDRAGNVLGTDVVNRTFEVSARYKVGDEPLFAALEDLNGDQRLDIVTTNSEDESVSVLLNQGSDIFLRQDYFIEDGFDSGTPVHVSVGDIDGQNGPDLFIAAPESYDQSIVGLPNDGNGGFGSPQSYGGDYYAGFTVLDDLDGDLDLDGLVGTGYGMVEIFQNDGTGSFTVSDSGVDVENYRSNSYDDVLYAVGDINNDSILDIVATPNEYADSVSVLLGDGTGHFNPQSPLPLDYTSPNAITLADVNNDLKLDLIASGFVYNSISVLLGDGQGNFTWGSSSDYSIGTAANAIAASDVNRDGKVDIVTANPNGSISILSGNGQGEFVLESTQPISTTASFVTVADMDGDGFDNIIVVDAQEDRVYVLP